MQVVYISGAYRGNKKPDTIFENIYKARLAAKKYWSRGYAVICPHMNTAFMDGACEDNIWIDGDLELLKRSDIIVMLPTWEKSEGAVIDHK